MRTKFIVSHGYVQLHPRDRSGTYRLGANTKQRITADLLPAAPA